MKKYIYMLKNAGNIQHLQNILDDNFIIHGVPASRCFYSEDGKRYIVEVTEGYMDIYHEISVQEFRFLIKNRRLRSGLSTPLCRYHAWRAIEKQANWNPEK